MVVVSHPTGNANVRAVLRAFESRGQLKAFHTTVAAKKGAYTKILPKAIEAKLRRRQYDLPNEKVHLRPWVELTRQSISRFGFGTKNQWVSRVYRDLDQHVAKWIKNSPLDDVNVMYGYEDGCSQTFAAAKERGMACIYDLPIAYWRTSQALLKQEQERWPDWAGTMQGLGDSEEKLARKEEELKQADVIMCCSKFVYDSLPDWARESKQCMRAEFGSDVPAMTGGERDDNDTSRPLRVLFVGMMTQRKGLADLFAAMKLLGTSNVELVILGQDVMPLSFYKDQYADFRYEGTKPRPQVLKLMRSCDVFILPTLVEGRALVLQEAMSCGLPLIITPNSGGEDLIEEGETGFLVPVRSPEAISERIEWFCNNRQKLAGMREKARDKAALYSWSEYERKVALAASGFLNAGKPLQPC